MFEMVWNHGMLEMWMYVTSRNMTDGDSWFPTHFSFNNAIKLFSVLTVEGLGVDGRHKICCQDTTWCRCKFKELKGINIYSTFS